MKAVLALLPVALAACSASTPEAPPSPTTLVTVTRPQRGDAPRLVEAFGTVAPAAVGVQTLSIAQPGQVVALSTTTGAAVRPGQPLAVFAVAPTARSAYVQATDALRAAAKQRGTTAELLGQQLATQDQLVQADKAVADARSALAALRAEGAGAGTTTLRAPFAGVVTAVPVGAGDRTQAGQALITVARSGAMLVTVGVDPSLRPQLHTSSPVTLSRLSDGSAAIAGYVVRVGAALNPRTHQIDVDVGYPAGALLPGEPIRAAIAVGSVSGWTVPHRSVVVDADGKAQVFQVAAGKAKAVAVTVLAGGSDRDTVTGPIDSRLPLVVDGAYQLNDGVPIRRTRER